VSAGASEERQSDEFKSSFGTHRHAVCSIIKEKSKSASYYMGISDSSGHVMHIRLFRFAMRLDLVVYWQGGTELVTSSIRDD